MPNFAITPGIHIIHQKQSFKNTKWRVKVYKNEMKNKIKNKNKLGYFKVKVWDD